jgi:hypothetical protein
MPPQFLTNRFKSDSFQPLWGIKACSGQVADLADKNSRPRSRKYQSAYKPGFVPMKLPSRWMAIHLEHLLPNASRNQPGRRAGKGFETEVSCHPY